MSCLPLHNRKTPPFVSAVKEAHLIYWVATKLRNCQNNSNRLPRRARSETFAFAALSVLRGENAFPCLTFLVALFLRPLQLTAGGKLGVIDIDFFDACIVQHMRGLNVLKECPVNRQQQVRGEC